MRLAARLGSASCVAVVASHYLPSHEKFPPNPAPKSGKLPNRVAGGALMDEETMFAFDCELSPSR